jgi:hypothetical protein
MESFALVVGDSEADVRRALSSHPDLVPVAAATADSLIDRKQTGTGLTRLGFSILGLGIVVGTYA